MAWLLGPHDITFWYGTWDLLALISHSIIEPLRICLIATTLAWCLDRSAAATAARPTAEAEAESRNPVS